MNNLAYFRNNKGITQRELAKELNVSNSAIAMWETNERSPSLNKAKEISNYFNVSIEEIFFSPFANTLSPKSTK